MLKLLIIFTIFQEQNLSIKYTWTLHLRPLQSHDPHFISSLSFWSSRSRYRLLVFLLRPTLFSPRLHHLLALLYNLKVFRKRRPFQFTVSPPSFFVSRTAFVSSSLPSIALIRLFPHRQYYFNPPLPGPGENPSFIIIHRPS